MSGQASSRLQAQKDQEARAGQYPHLPRELWEKICHLLTTKEVAQRLGPTCMALYR